MPAQDYTATVRKMLEKNPELELPLKKALKALSRQKDCVPHQITLCRAGESDLFSLNSLFSPSAIRRRNDKIIFLPDRMNDTVKLRDWLTAVSEVIGTEAKAEEFDGKADLLLGQLEMLFPRLSDSVTLLQENRCAVRNRISEAGAEKAFDYYQLILKTVSFLKDNDAVMSPADLGARICGDSKMFKRGSAIWNTTSKLLAEELCGNPETVMGECGITENPTSLTVTVFGPFVCYRGNEAFDWIRCLWALGEAATLNAGNLEHIDRIGLEAEKPLQLISSENESPFNQMMRAHNPTALIYTAGFPNSAVKRFLSLIPEDMDYLHWGDTDPEGLLIASILNCIKPLKLYRCNIEDCTRLSHCLRHLDEKKLKRGRKLLESSDFTFKKELEFTLENGWLEQEAWLGN